MEQKGKENCLKKVETVTFLKERVAVTGTNFTF
jgi:hypothetical protein